LTAHVGTAKIPGVRYSPSYLREALLHRAEKLWGRPFRESLDRALAELRFAREGQREAERLRRSNGHQGLKLHLGCGADVRPGWLNLDLNLNDDGRPGSPEYFRIDLRRPLPLRDESVSFVYSSHVWEHLTNPHGLQLFKESYRVLGPGGVFRIALPNQELMCKFYLERNWAHIRRFFDQTAPFPGVPEGELTYAEYFDEAIYQQGEHVAFYDAERTVRVLKSVGFKDVRETEYAEGLDPDDELRRIGSFYVQAVR
jgi:predicted SAM-dependent methyltransferase